MKYIEKTILQSNSYSTEFDKLMSGAKTLYKLCDGMKWAEGPAYVDDSIIISDVKANTMYRYSFKEGKSVFRKYSHYANGNCIDKEKRLITCEHGRRCISRTEHDGSVTILADMFDGKRLNSPNDVVVKSDGTIWFTDPPYGIVSNDEGYKSESQIVGCYVYQYSPHTGEVTAVITDTQRPNGLAFSPCEKILYVADMSIVDFPTQGRRHIRVYGIGESHGRSIATIEPGIPDGFAVDGAGRLFVSFEHGIKVLLPTGECVGEFFVPERVSNCTFGNTCLFITATSSLYCVEIDGQL